MIYNKISGSSVNTATALLFKQFDSEQCYLAFAKRTETWGMCTLVNISLPTNSLVDIMVQTTAAVGRFVDEKSPLYTLATSTVRLYYTDGSVPDFSADMTRYHSIKDQNTIDTNIYLNYINSTWCELKNLPSNYRDFLNTLSNQKFYIAAQQIGDTYPDTPSVGTQMVKINLKPVQGSTLNENVILNVHIPVPGGGSIIKQYPPTTPDGGIVRSTTLLGETSFSGLADTINESIALTYVNETMSNPGTFFDFTNIHGASVTTPLYLQSTLKADGITRTIYFYEGTGDTRKYILFKTQHSYMVGTNMEKQDYFVKISFSSPPTELAIYNETLPFIYPVVNSANNISDSNPPGLDLTYLNNISIHDSMFDVQGYVRIRKAPNTNNDLNIFSQISYAKELVSTNIKQKYVALGFSQTDMSQSRRIETITMTVPQPVSRYGNVRPMPNGRAYSPNDVGLYLWSTNFIVGDTIAVKADVSNPESVITKIITGIDYDEGYITFATGLGSGMLGRIVTHADNDLILSDLSQIVSVPSTIINRIEYAVCSDMKDALLQGMDSVMIDMQIPPSGVGLYDGVYRQIAVCHRPQFNDLTITTNGTQIGALVDCTSSGSDAFCESDVASLYYDGPNGTNHSWEPGTILYIANKTPVYRRYITSRESFKLII